MASRNRAHYVLAFLSLFCLITYADLGELLIPQRFSLVDANHDWISAPGDIESVARNRKAQYCASSPFGAQDETIFDVPGSTLLQAYVIVRHGDRSNLGRIPGAKRNFTFACGSPQAERNFLSQVLRPVLSTPECILQANKAPKCDSSATSTGASRSDLVTFGGSSADWTRQRIGFETCAGGDLTTLGWNQLFTLGHEAGKAYSSLLQDDRGPSSVPLSVVSTNTSRTILSASAFVTGVLYAHSYNGSNDIYDEATGELQSRPLTPISLRDAVSSKILPGLQYPLPLHVLERSKDVMLWAKDPSVCLSAALVREQMDAELRPLQEVQQSIQEKIHFTTNIDPETLPHNDEFVDDLFTRACHNHPPPCWHSRDEHEHDVCLTWDEIALVLFAGDLEYLQRFQNTDITRLLSYPFLQHLLSQMSLARSHRHEIRTPHMVPRLSVRATHDTVLGAVLGAFGLLNDHFPWPNYGARLNLELWRVGEVRNIVGKDELETSTDGQDVVRVLYNGLDVSRDLPCARPYPVRIDRKSPRRAKRGGAGDVRYACPFDSFVQLVESFIAPHKSWEEACHVPNYEGPVPQFDQNFGVPHPYDIEQDSKTKILSIADTPAAVVSPSSSGKGVDVSVIGEPMYDSMSSSGRVLNASAPTPESSPELMVEHTDVLRVQQAAKPPEFVFTPDGKIVQPRVDPRAVRPLSKPAKKDTTSKALGTNNNDSNNVPGGSHMLAEEETIVQLQHVDTDDYYTEDERDIRRPPKEL